MRDYVISLRYVYSGKSSSCDSLPKSMHWLTVHKTILYSCNYRCVCAHCGYEDQVVVNSPGWAAQHYSNVSTACQNYAFVHSCLAHMFLQHVKNAPLSIVAWPTMHCCLVSPHQPPQWGVSPSSSLPLPPLAPLLRFKFPHGFAPSVLWGPC